MSSEVIAARLGRVGGGWAAGLCVALALCLPPLAMAAPTSKAPASGSKAAAAPDTGKASNPLSGPGWRVAPRPSWVVDAPDLPAVPQADLSYQPQAKQRFLLSNVQANYQLPKSQYYTQTRVTSTEPAGLTQIAQQQLSFNPAFQQVLLHDLAVWRDGRREDRLKSARIELLRRERRLEQSIIDGTQTLSIVLSDVRVNDIVEVAYTTEGMNPIYEGRIATGFLLGESIPTDRVFARLLAPASKPLQSKFLAVDGLEPVKRVDGGSQVWTLSRSKVAPVEPESAVPPWFKAYPSWQLSEWTDWPDVQRWAAGLFKGDEAAPKARLQAQIQTLLASGLSGEALANEAIRFVQDDIRYFSTSLGESSHRPKPAEQTLEQRMGDCKDKVVLLNALLDGLGFEARPALVSTYRLKGLTQFLPGPEQFDHVITQLKVGGKAFYVDATVSGQGTRMDTRGVLDYGVVLVAGEKNGLTSLPLPQSRLDHLLYEQHWDFSEPGKPVSLRAVMQAKGLTAERMRAVVASGQLKGMAESFSNALIRVYPQGLRVVGEPTLEDDRPSNVIKLTVLLEHPDWRDYEKGALKADFGAPELAEFVAAPKEAQRKMPMMLDTTRLVDSKIILTLPKVLKLSNLKPFELQDEHLRYSHRWSVEGKQLLMVRTMERKASEVAPAQFSAYRDITQKVRGNLGSAVRIPMVDFDVLKPGQITAIESTLKEQRQREDELTRMVVRFRLENQVHTASLLSVAAGSGLQATVLTERALNHNLLGEHAKGLSDANQALAIDAKLDDAKDAKAAALLGTNRWDEAKPIYEALRGGSLKGGALKYLGSIAVLEGRGKDAEAVLKEALEGGADRDFTILWLALATEQTGGKAADALAPFLSQLDAQAWPSTLVRWAAGQLSDSELLAKAKADARQARLQLSEAYFYIGLRQHLQGNFAAAKQQWRQCLEQGAVMYREHTFAQQMLAR